jgi:hypothetical protein
MRVLQGVTATEPESRFSPFPNGSSSTGLQHAVWAGISGFFLGIAVNYRRRRIPLPLMAVTIPAVPHGLNDWTAGFSTLWVLILVQAFSLLLFLGYTLPAGQISSGSGGRRRSAASPC